MLSGEHDVGRLIVLTRKENRWTNQASRHKQYSYIEQPVRSFRTSPCRRRRRRMSRMRRIYSGGAELVA
eukprot:763159-Hanusia_phi.AAC.3